MKELKVGSFTLGAFLVQPEHNKLKKNEEEFKIEPKIMQVLCYLVQHKHEVVSRSTIAEALWPDTITGLEVVTRAIFELRKTLNDDPKNPTYIETIARKGYCFIYDAAPVITAKPNKCFIQKLFTKSTKLNLLVASSLLILLVLLQGFSDSKSVDLNPAILTDLTSYADMPAISPDEKQLLFVKKRHFKEAISQLVLLDLASQQQKEITAVNAEYKSPLWSAGSDYWFYIRCEKTASCDVVKHDINSHKVENIFSIKQQLFSFALSNDNNYLILSLWEKNRMALALVDITDPESRLNFFGAGAEYSFNNHPVFSHDGNSVYYISTTPDAASQIYRYDLVNQTSTKVSDNYDRIRGLALKDEHSLWVSGNKQESNGIWIFDLANNQSSKVFKTFPGYFPALLSSQLNADKLIYTNYSRTINFSAQGINDLDNLEGANSSMIDMNAVYSTHLKALYFISNRNGLYDIWRFKENALEKITNIKANMIERPILNLQQDKLAYLSRKNSQTEMTIFDLINNVEIKRIILPKKVLLLSWSNEQQYIYFNRFEAGQYNVYKLDVDTEKESRILLNAGGIVQESEDGQSLFYGDRLNKQFMQKMASGETRLLFKLPENEKGLSSYGLKVINNGIYYTSEKENKYVLNYYSFSDQTLNEYMELPDGVYVTDIVKGDSIGVIYDKFVGDNSNLIELTM